MVFLILKVFRGNGSFTEVGQLVSKVPEIRQSSEQGDQRERDQSREKSVKLQLSAHLNTKAGDE